MIVRLGNTAPVYIKNHDATCIPECPARHDEIVGWDTVTDDDAGTITQTPVYDSVHDGTVERVVVDIGSDPYRVTEFSLTVPDDDLDGWLDRATRSIVDEGNGGWAAHSNAAPAWVESNWPELERRLASWFGCPVGEPAAENEES